MISFVKYKNVLLLAYQPENNLEWVESKFSKDEELKLRRTFFLKKEHQYSQAVVDYRVTNSEYAFEIAKLEGEYYKFDKDIFNTDHCFLMHKSIAFNIKHFVASTNKSIFKSIDRLVTADVYIGGKNTDTLPYTTFLGLINGFPNTYELWRYSNARIDSVLRAYFDTKGDEEKKYNAYMNKKSSTKGSNLLDIVKNSELAKYKVILNKLTQMLKDEAAYSEKQWQIEILQILQLIYPKYINVFDEAPVKDTYNNKSRSIDYILIDANGNIDIAEIKKPFTYSIVTKTQYRDNHIPLRELSGTIMQIEKYIFYLNKWGKTGEDKLTEKYKKHLPNGFRIKITNPGAIIIMGRSKNLNKQQNEDFEIIKRKYKNIIDILTYDDLLSRLKLIISNFGIKSASAIVAPAEKDGQVLRQKQIKRQEEPPQKRV